MKSKLSFLFFIPTLCLVVSVLSANAKTIMVSQSADSGPGTFRDAIAQVNGDSSVSNIKFKPKLATVWLKTPVIYSGTQSLIIDGADGTISQKGSSDLFVVKSGADISLFNISFTRALKSGVTVNVPPGDAARNQTVLLKNVTLKQNGWYGLHFDDQSGGDGGGVDSASSLRLVVIDSKVEKNNNPALAPSASDKDGIRVDEGGVGDVTVVIVRSSFDKNAAEGIEIDETGPGDVILNVSGSSFNSNGSQPQKLSDLEDGLDVDEAGPGSIRVNITESAVSLNRDEGIDLDEADEGEIYFTAVDIKASRNTDENIKITQLGSGNITALLRETVVKDSLDGDGVKLESFDNGKDENPVGAVFVSIDRSSFTFNDSDDLQIEAASGEVMVSASTIG
ncbi:MAG: hypothetical protein OXC97_04190, partial [Candidatus Dadabacteria bacterium]|nr:hypothetical protein [Candidatus Dadabacteria bacterium]